jgi:hypothetical protein
MDKEELEEIEKIADEDLFEFDSDLDITDNLILFGRRLLFRIVAVVSSLIFILLTNVQCQRGIFNSLLNMDSVYVENYYLYDFDNDLSLEFKVPDIPTMKDAGEILFITSKFKETYSDGFSRDVSPGKIVYPPKNFDDFDKNIKVIRPDNKKLKVHYLSNTQIIVKIRESSLHKGRGLKEKYSTISDIYLGGNVKYKKSR